MQRSPDEVVAAARTWVGTRYSHQQRVKQVGVDCVGLILGVGIELGLMGDDTDELFARFKGYSRVPNPRRMQEGMELFLDPTIRTKHTPGAIGWLQWRDDLPMHLAIMATFEGRPTMIHSYSFAGKCVEHTFDELWESRLNSIWTYRGVSL